ncbi:MAG: hypothetical protein PHY92_03565 [Alphaproteobacteria bacterium]|nr:hypothetical protein [Alphaproteobacteria bacterium]
MCADLSVSYGPSLFQSRGKSKKGKNLISQEREKHRAVAHKIMQRAFDNEGAKTALSQAERILKRNAGKPVRLEAYLAGIMPFLPRMAGANFTGTSALIKRILCLCERHRVNVSRENNKTNPMLVRTCFKTLVSSEGLSEPLLTALAGQNPSLAFKFVSYFSLTRLEDNVFLTRLEGNVLAGEVINGYFHCYSHLTGKKGTWSDNAWLAGYLLKTAGEAARVGVSVLNDLTAIGRTQKKFGKPAVGRMRCDEPRERLTDLISKRPCTGFGCRKHGFPPNPLFPAPSGPNNNGLKL